MGTQGSRVWGRQVLEEADRALDPGTGGPLPRLVGTPL